MTNYELYVHLTKTIARLSKIANNSDDLDTEDEILDLIDELEDKVEDLTNRKERYNGRI